MATASSLEERAKPAAEVVAGLWQVVGADPSELDGLALSGDEPVLPSVFPVTTAALAAVGATTQAVARLAGERGGCAGAPQASADGFEATVAFRSERLLRIDGGPPADLWGPLSGDYRTADGWVRLHCNFDHHRRAAQQALGQEDRAPDDRSAMAAELAGRAASEVEEAVVAAGGCAAAMRSPDEWRAHQQAAVLARAPVVALRRVEPGDPAARPRRLLPAGTRPLDGVRVLDLTRVIAGPVCGRVLAGHGADVLAVGAEHLPTFPPLVVDTGFGKRSCHLDLRRSADRVVLERLAGEADVFVQGYRPGALAGRGFGADDLAGRHPGLVVVNVSAYGAAGPWGGRRGFDSLVQMVSGIAAEGARVAGREAPLSLPAQALDHATGWLAAFGALAALRRREQEGGSWVVDVTLAGTAAWLDSLGRVPGGLAVPEPAPDALAPILTETPSAFGLVRHVRLPGRIDGVRPTWATPPVPPGTDPPTFTPRST